MDLLCPALGGSSGGGCAYALGAASRVDVSKFKTNLTTSVGVAVSSSWGGATGGYSVCLSSDNYGNWAFQETSSLGASTGLGASVVAYRTITNAKDVQDLSGESSSFGFSIGNGYMLAVDIVTFVPASDPDSRKWGITIGVGLGAGVEGHIGNSFTTSQDSWTIRDLIQDLRWGG